MSTNDDARKILLVRGPELGPRQARVLLDEARAALRAGVKILILDVGEIAYIDSLGIAAMAAVAEEASPTTLVVIAGATPYVMRIVHMTRLHEIIDMYASVEAATRALAA